MATAKFDRNEIVEKLVSLFWKNGFNGSSMQMVSNATGLKPGSIYNTFGNKEALFHEAIEKYSQEGIVKMRKILDNAPSIGEGICIILDNFINRVTRKPYSSCFLIKLQLELNIEGTELHSLASDKLKDRELFFRSYLEKDFDKALAKRYAINIMTHIFGLNVYGYQKCTVEELRQCLRDGLPWLPWDSY